MTGVLKTGIYCIKLDTILLHCISFSKAHHTRCDFVACNICVQQGNIHGTTMLHATYYMQHFSCNINLCATLLHENYIILVLS